MNVEYECTCLEINKEELIKKLEKMGAKREGDFFQKRYVYDFNPKIPNKLIRLRTNGVKSTLTIKNVLDKNSIGGTLELEIEVSDFEKTNLILEELGYHHRNYQENKRTTYSLDGVNFDIDSWPFIPTYVEIEGYNEEIVKEMITRLNLDNEKITNYDVTSIYKEIYNIDVLSIKDLYFEENLTSKK